MKRTASEQLPPPQPAEAANKAHGFFDVNHAGYLGVPTEMFLDLGYSLSDTRLTHTVIVPRHNQALSDGGQSKTIWLTKLSPMARLEVKEIAFNLLARTICKMLVTENSRIASMLMSTLIDIAPANLLPRGIRAPGMMWAGTSLTRNLTVVSKAKKCEPTWTHTTRPQHCELLSVIRRSVPGGVMLGDKAIKVITLDSRGGVSTKAELHTIMGPACMLAVRAFGFDILVETLNELADEGEVEAAFLLDVVSDVLDDGREFEWVGPRYLQKLRALPAFRAGLKEEEEEGRAKKLFKPIAPSEDEGEHQPYAEIAYWADEGVK